MWTSFWDMHSGGGQKLQWDKIFIEASEEQAKAIFQKTFNRDPDNITCDCCGNDYSISEYETLEEATEFHRRGKTLEKYSKEPYVKVIYKDLA